MTIITNRDNPSTLSSFSQALILGRRLGRRAITQRANRLLSLCIIVCSGVAASLSFFAISVQTALDADIAKYLGAPMVIRSEQPLPPSLFSGNGLSKTVVTASFTTGATSENAYQSVSLKGVSDHYPLQGKLIVKTRSGEANVSAADLAKNTVWLDQRVIDELGIELGERIQIGRAELVVTGSVVHEPDRLTQLQHALPRAMVSLETLALTQVNIGNNRGEHRVLLDGPRAALDKLEAKLAATQKLNFDVLKPNKGQHPFSRISLRAERLLNVILVLILLLCGGASATLADYSVRNYTKPSAVLRCMGVNRRAVVWALCLQLFILALVMSLVGCALAWWLQPLLIDVMQPHMMLSMPSVKMLDLLGPIGIGLVTVIAFVIPKLQTLGSMPVVGVLRGQAGSAGPRKRSYATTIIVSAVVFGMLWFSSDNAELTIMLVGAVVALIILSVLFGWLLSKLSAQAHHFFRGPIKVALRSIGRSPSRHITPLVSVSIAMMAVLMTVTLRGSFLDVLQIQQLEVDGNYVYTGLPANQLDQFRRVVQEQGADIRGEYPTVTAKLVMINGVPIDDALTKESDTREETRSNVRLSWAKQLPTNNRLLNGEWPGPGSNDVSVESEVMSDLGIKLGDELGFQVGNTLLTSRVSSEREYKGGGSRMMFWFMFVPSALADFKQHYMGGLFVEGKASQALKAVGAHFPQLRVTDLEKQIAGIRSIMIVLTRLMNTTLVLLLAGALMVIVATSFVSVSNRHIPNTLMRVIGVRRTQCYAMNMAEQLVVGLVACFIGLLGVQLIGGAMFQNLFALSYEPEWRVAALLTAIITLSFIVLGWLFAFRQLRQPIAVN